MSLQLILSRPGPGSQVFFCLRGSSARRFIACELAKNTKGGSAVCCPFFFTVDFCNQFQFPKSCPAWLARSDSRKRLCRKWYCNVSLKLARRPAPRECSLSAFVRFASIGSQLASRRVSPELTCGIALLKIRARRHEISSKRCRFS
jgi:hypothetical protein